MADPREKRTKSLYMKVFFGDKDLYNEFLELYDAAVDDGSVNPEGVAMIHFRDKYVEIDEKPGWVEKT